MVDRPCWWGSRWDLMCGTSIRIWTNSWYSTHYEQMICNNSEINFCEDRTTERKSTPDAPWHLEHGPRHGCHMGSYRVGCTSLKTAQQKQNLPLMHLDTLTPWARPPTWVPHGLISSRLHRAQDRTTERKSTPDAPWHLDTLSTAPHMGATWAHIELSWLICLVSRLGRLWPNWIERDFWDKLATSTTTAYISGCLLSPICHLRLYIFAEST